jgi:Uma2 family endonuclease
MSSIAERTASMSAMPLKYEEEVEYPSSDGKPMAESPTHLLEMLYVIAALRRRYRAEPDVYAIGNMLFYYREGDPRSVISPDVFVVKGIPDKRRDIFQLWKEKNPCFVMEITSKSTRRADLRLKKDLYQWMGVEEYILHDPRGEYLDPPLQGYRLVDGRYQPMILSPDGSLVSRTTGLRLLRDGEHLVLIELESGEMLPTYDEMGDDLEEALEEIRLKDEALRLRDETIRQQDEALRRSEASRGVLEEELVRLRRELESRREG